MPDLPPLPDPRDPSTGPDAEKPADPSAAARMAEGDRNDVSEGDRNDRPTTASSPHHPSAPVAGDGTPNGPNGADPVRFPPPEGGSADEAAGARPGYAQPAYGQPGYAQPGAQPGYGEPGAQSGYAQPGYGPPLSGDRPASSAPVSPSLGYTQYSQPGYGQPGYGQPGYGQPGYVQPQGGSAHGSGGTGGPRRGLAIAALVVGGVSVLFAVIPVLSYLAVVTAVVGVVLGIIAIRQKDGSKGLALGGLITSAVALLLAIVLSVVYTNWFISSFDELESSASPSEPEDPFDDGLGGGTDGGTDDTTTGLGSRDEPDAIGATSQFRDGDELPVWEVTPGSPTLDANSLVAADEYNEPAPAGTQYAILPLTITYVGTETGQPYEVEVQFVAADGTSYDTDDVYAVIPEDLYDVNELYPGGSATGNVVIPIPADAVEGGTWAIRTVYDGPYFYSVQ